MPTRYKLILSAFLAAIVMMALYFAGNYAIALSWEKDLLTRVENWLDMVGDDMGEPNDSVMFINVANDRYPLVAREDQLNSVIGYKYITDRKKLAELLAKLHEYDNYRYILLDITFNPIDTTQYDSELFSLIKSMPRIVMPKVVDSDDSIYSLNDKTAFASYRDVNGDRSFSKFKYFYHGEPTIPLKMYNELNNRSISRHGPFYTDCNSLARSAVIIPFVTNADKWYSIGTFGPVRNWLNLGFDLLGDTIQGLGEEGIGTRLIDLPEMFDDMYIVIGSFQGNDMHNTYDGDKSGSEILINAYFALVNGHHRISLISIIALFSLYWLLIYIMLCRDDLTRETQHNKKLRALALAAVSGRGLTIILVALCLVTYFTTGFVLDLFISLTFLALISWSINHYPKIKNKIQLKLTKITHR